MGRGQVLFISTGIKAAGTPQHQQESSAHGRARGGEEISLVLPARNNWDHHRCSSPLLEPLQEHTAPLLPLRPREHQTRVTSLLHRSHREKPTWDSEFQFPGRGGAPGSISALTWSSLKGCVLTWSCWDAALTSPAQPTDPLPVSQGGFLCLSLAQGRFLQVFLQNPLGFAGFPAAGAANPRCRGRALTAGSGSCCTVAPEKGSED